MKLPQKYSKLTWQEKREVREKYTILQQGKCYYCKGSLSLPVPQDIKEKRIDWDLFPPNFLKYPVHLHHDHKTDLTLGAVHSYCNAVLWYYHGE